MLIAGYTPEESLPHSKRPGQAVLPPAHSLTSDLKAAEFSLLRPSQAADMKSADLNMDNNGSQHHFKELEHSGGKILPQGQMTFFQQSKSHDQNEQLVGIGNQERLSTERPKGTDGPQALHMQILNASDGHHGLPNQVEAALLLTSEQAKDLHELVPFRSQSMTSVPLKGSHPRRAEDEGQSPTPKLDQLDQNEAARQIWEQSNYNSGYTHNEFAGLSVERPGKSLGLAKKQIYINRDTGGRQDASKPGQEREGTTGQQSYSTKDKMPLSPKFKTRSSSRQEAQADLAQQNSRGT